MTVFLWCRTGLFTSVLLPLGVAMLRGRAPRRARTRWSPARIRVQGGAALSDRYARWAGPWTDPSPARLPQLG